MPSQGVLDPPAGERARQMCKLPAPPPRIFDPTDPRCGPIVRNQSVGVDAAVHRTAPPA
jgi:hypothetical protein